MARHVVTRLLQASKRTDRTRAAGNTLAAMIPAIQACLVLAIASGGSAQAQCQLGGIGGCTLLNPELPGQVQPGMTGYGIQEVGVTGGRFEPMTPTTPFINTNTNTPRPILDKSTKMSTPIESATITLDAFGGQCVIPTKGIPYGDCH